METREQDTSGEQGYLPEPKERAAIRVALEQYRAALGIKS